MIDPAGIYQVPTFFQTTELPGVYPRPKQYPPITGMLITYVHIQYSSPGFILHKNKETRAAQDYQIYLVTSVGQTLQGEATVIFWG